MNVLALIAELRERGVKLQADGPLLRWKGPRSVLTEETVALLAERKPEILEALLEEELIEYGLVRCSRCSRILLRRHVRMQGGEPRCIERGDCSSAKMIAEAYAEDDQREEESNGQND